MSNTSADPHKVKLERAVAEEFLLPYNLATGRAFVVLRAGEPPEPDVLCLDRSTGEEIGIEVGTAYYEPDHARAIWKRARGREVSTYFIRGRDRIQNVRVLAQALRIIRAKSRKSRTNYRVSGRLLLVVLTYPQRLYLSDVEERLGTLRIPSSHPFNEMHIVSQYGEVYCLFPARGWVLQ